MWGAGVAFVCLECTVMFIAVEKKRTDVHLLFAQLNYRLPQ